MNRATLPQVCRSCGAELTHLQAFHGDLCDRLECRGELYRQQARRLREITRDEDRQLDLQVANQALQILGREVEHIESVAVVPRTDAQLTITPPERLRAFRESLQRAIDEAMHDWSPDPGASQEDWEQEILNEAPPNTTVVGACSTCRGACCRHAHEHAFIDYNFIRFYLQRHPEVSPEELFDRYVENLPGISIDGSCVYHGEYGCQLDREMRSITCNDAHCDRLRDHLAQLVELKISTEVIVAASYEGDIGRIAVLETDGTRRLCYEVHPEQESSSDPAR